MHSERTRVRYEIQEDGIKVRVSKKTGTVIPKPAADYKYLMKATGREKTPLDTEGSKVVHKTYMGEDFVKVYKDFMQMIQEKEAKEKLLVFKK